MLIVFMLMIVAIGCSNDRNEKPSIDDLLIEYDYKGKVDPANICVNIDGHEYCVYVIYDNTNSSNHIFVHSGNCNNHIDFNKE